MNTSNLIITAIVGIISMALFVLVIQFLSKKINYEEDGKPKIAFAIWIGFAIASFVILLSISLKAISNAIEVIMTAKNDESSLLVIEKIALFTGFTFMGFLATYYVTQFITTIIFCRRTNSIEIERNNYTYFIIKGMFLLAFTFVLGSVFENLLRLFSPIIDIPFYH